MARTVRQQVPLTPAQKHRCTWFLKYDRSECTSCVGIATTIQGDSGGKVNIWEVIVPVLVRKEVHMNMCLILNGYRDTAV